MFTWSHPFRRRDKFRPTSAIAFCAATAVTNTPPAEIHLLRSFNNDFSQITLLSLTKTLKALRLDDPLFAEALFEIADVCNIGHVKCHHLLIFYALLRRLAFAPSAALKLALQEILYFIFTSAAGSEAATHLCWKQWHRFASKLGHTIGGSDSLPSEEAEYLLNRAWPRKSIMSSPSISFQGFVRMLRQYDGGMVLKLRAIGYLLTTCVIEKAHTHTEMPQWDVLVEDSRVLSQFITHTISLRMQPGGSAQLSELRSSLSGGSIPAVADSHQGLGVSNPDSDKLASPSASEPQLTPPEESVFADRRRGPAIRPKPFSYPLNSPQHMNVLGRRSNGTCKPSAVVSRSNDASGKKSPFHIDYSALTLGEKIGSGAYGDVYKGTFLMSPVAVKMFHVNISSRASSRQGGEGHSPTDVSRMSTMTKLQRFASINSQNKYCDFVREVEMMSVVRHPNLVLYMGVCGDPLSPLCIVCELFNGGSLYEYLHTESEFCPSVSVATQIGLGIGRGMFYLHSSEPSILHRDLKSTNVLLGERRAKDGAPHVVICDFGLCQLFGEDGEHTMGTASYMSPNVIRRECYEKQDDTYSFGVLLFEIFTGSVPFEGMGATQVMFQVASSGLRPSYKGEGEMIPARIGRLIERCWDEEKKKRPLFDEVISELELFESERVITHGTKGSSVGEAAMTCNSDKAKLDELQTTISSVSAGGA
ncbi:Serine/threonine-protein kinase HT1 [Gracilariopsis chorda]|uniref:Serine/threonine-protein kinase HT1 n=1 Tax=Gracilariopsis chorda TaxID=448386 RepID=A0A2V3J138_9FLOR|nr:Serine/threonine-protein kinase HT1 [Gracilariopsis chorda]|eukprot:PXF48035.1 Serine/threonine-protein kinase HT1 [Gracilariopsis chorda]